MKHQVTRFKSLKIALKELEQYIRDADHLQTGRPLKKFGDARSREILANWLICVAVNHSTDADRLEFTSDPIGSDGIIRDKKTNETWPMEHVMVPMPQNGPKTLDQRILKAINNKSSKGKAYAQGKTLVVFINTKGKWSPIKITKKLPQPIYFEAVWVVGLCGVENGEYIYNICRLDLTQNSPPLWQVRIASDFQSWQVK